jgi:transcriptional regulator with XRE-family HTH domain
MASPSQKTIHSRRYERFRELIVGAREEAGLTQTQLAELLGRPQSFVSKYETGERRIDIEEFIQISEALSIDPSDLVRRLVKEGK